MKEELEKPKPCENWANCSHKKSTYEDGFTARFECEVCLKKWWAIYE